MTLSSDYLRNDPRHVDAMRLGSRNGAALQYLPRLVRSRRSRAMPGIWAGVAWAVLPSLIGGALFLAVVGVCVGLVP